MAIIELG